MPNITVTVDQTIHPDRRVRAARMAAFTGRPNVRPSHSKLGSIFFVNL